MNGSTRAGGHSSLTLTKPIAKCGVLYLGSATPRPDIVGIESIQDPLSKRYPVDSTNNVYGIDSLLIVRENGVELTFNQDPTISLFYPIESLVYCASVRFATPYSQNEYNQSQQWPYKHKWGFAPLDSPFANTVENQHHPPLFCAIFKRTRNVAADECHCFITKTKESAMILVHACFTAFNKQQQRNPARFYSNSLSNRKVPLYIKSEAGGQSCYEVDHGHVRVIEAPTSQPIVDYMTNPKGDGFFYTAGNVSIDTWQLWEERNKTEEPQPVQISEAEENSSEESSSFESSTEYYHGISKKYSLPKEIADNISNATTKYGAVDPYEPAPNLVKVEHKRDPTTGANIFVRWFQPEESDAEKASQKSESPDTPKLPPAPRVSREKNGKQVVIIREMNINDKQKNDDSTKQNHSRLKSILRKTRRSHERSKVNVADEGLFDKKAYQITEAYFEDRKGKVHRVINKKDKGNHRRLKLLDDMCEEEEVNQNEVKSSIKAKNLPIGARLADPQVSKPREIRHNHQSLQRSKNRSGQRRHHSNQDSMRQRLNDRAVNDRHSRSHFDARKYQPDYHQRQVNQLYAPPHFRHENVQQQMYRGSKENRMLRPPVMWGPVVNAVHPFYQAQMYSMM